MTQGHGLRRTQQTIDVDLLLEDGAGAIITSQVGSEGILDLGGGGQPNSPTIYGDLVVDVYAITTGGASGETYELILEGSDSATFASGIEEVARMNLGDAAGTVMSGGQDVDSDVGRYAIAFSNERNGRTYRYVRLNFIVGGTAPSILCGAFLMKRV